MSDQWFSALKRVDNAYVMEHLEECFLSLDEGSNSSLTTAVLYANKEAIEAICSRCASTLEASHDENQRAAVLTSLTQGMMACLRNDEAGIFALIYPYLLSAQVVSHLDMVERAIKASAYSILKLLLQDEELSSKDVEKVLQSIHSPQSAQYTRVLDLLVHRTQAQAEPPSNVGKRSVEATTTTASNVGIHTLTEEWMMRATKPMLQEAIKALQAELLKEQSQSRKYQEIISSILSNEKQSHISVETKIRNLTGQLESQTKQLREKDEEIERLTVELSKATQVSEQVAPTMSLALTPNAPEGPHLKEDLAVSSDTDSVCKQMLSEYSLLKSNLLTLGLESSIISQNLAKVSLLTEIANTEIKTLKKSCLDAITEAEEIRNRLSIVQHERDALNEELQQLKQDVNLLRQSPENESGEVAAATSRSTRESANECRTSDSIPLAAHHDAESRIVDTMTIYSYLEDEEGKKGVDGALEGGACDMTGLLEKLAEHGVHVESSGPTIYLRVADPARLSALLQDALQQPGASILYPSEFSVANFRQLEHQVEPPNAHAEGLQPSQLKPEGALTDTQELVAQLTTELMEKDKVIAELNHFIEQIPSAGYNEIDTQRVDEGVGGMEKVACILYQRALFERDKALRDIEENKDTGDNPYTVSFVTQRKLNSIIPCEEASLRELFSKACLRHDVIHEDADAIWLEVLEITIRTRNYHLSEYLRSKLTRISNVLHEQCNRGATLHGFVPMNNLAAVYLLAPRFSNIRDQNGRTALMVAAELDQLDIARVLLPYEAGAQTSKGHTALMMAAQLGYLRVVEELSPLEGHILDQRGRSAIYYATDGSVYKDVSLSKQIVETIQNRVHSSDV